MEDKIATIKSYVYGHGYAYFPVQNGDVEAVHKAVTNNKVINFDTVLADNYTSVIKMYFGLICEINKNNSEADKWYSKCNLFAICSDLVKPPYMTNGLLEKSMALKLLMKGVENGCGNCMNAIGDMYWNGDVVVKNREIAKSYYEKAMSKGVIAAYANYADYYYCGGSMGDKDYQTAVKYYTHAFEHGYLRAGKNLALCYLHGFGLDQNYNEAFRIMCILADRGYSDIMVELANLYWSGKGCVRNYAKSVELYTMAAKKGNYEAFSHLAECYEMGTGFTKDIGRAITLYKFAAENNVKYAIKRLESMFPSLDVREYILTNSIEDPNTLL